MAWLLRGSDVLAAVEPGRGTRMSDLHGARVMRRPALLQTVTAAVSLDVAWCADVAGEDGRMGLEVRRIACLGPHRVGRPHLTGGAVVVAEQGAFERWHLQVGDRLEIR